MNYNTVLPNVVLHYQQSDMAIVEETITKHTRGRVKFMGTYWFARFLDSAYERDALPKTIVKVVDREGLTLLVIPSS